MSNHYRKTVLKYVERKKTPGCPFCKPETLAKAVYENKHVFVVPNLTQYDLWELYDVVDHLLVVPKRHAKSLDQLNKTERLAIMDICAEYEPKGYNIYARGNGFINRSVEHQHTHLIKVTNKRPRLTIFLHKPYFLIKL